MARDAAVELQRLQAEATAAQGSDAEHRRQTEEAVRAAGKRSHEARAEFEDADFEQMAAVLLAAVDDAVNLETA